MAPPKIAMVGLASENCTFSAGRTTLDDFRVLEGQALLAERYPFLQEERFARAHFLPLIHSRALPGGMITRETYNKLKDDLLGRLHSSLPVDAVYLDLHGAMHVEGMEDVEQDLAVAIRSLAGNGCVLGASMDLHGNVSAELVEVIDIFSAYRTAPHIDTEATRARVCQLLLEALDHGWELERAWVPIPVLLPGEKTSTLHEPARSIYAGLPGFDDCPGVVDVSLWVGYVWADEARAHASVVVTGRRDKADTKVLAEEVARRYWDLRADFRFRVPSGSFAECLEQAVREAVKPVVISDSGDNPTAGGVGNLPYALGILSEHQVFVSGRKRAIVAGIWDPAAVAACLAAGVGAEIEPGIGGGCDPRHSAALTLRGTVKQMFEHDPIAGRQVIFQVGGGIQVVLTERRKPFHYFKDFHGLGLQPEEADLVLVKMGYLVTDLQALAAKAYLALTPGAVDQHVTRLPYANLVRPMFPFDEDFEWKPKARRCYSRARKS